MKQILYISFFLFLSFLLNSCKIKIIEDSNTPYSIFEKGSKKGVINTISKEILIPAKFGWIEKYISKYEYPSTNETFYFATYPNEDNSFYLKSFLYDSKGKLIYTFGVGESIKLFFYYKKRFYLITKTEILIEPIKQNEIGIKEYEGNLLLINENHAEIILTQCSLNNLGSKNIISFTFNNQKGYFDLNSRKKIIQNSDNFHSPMYVENRNEIWFKHYNKETGKTSNYFESVLDSTLNIKPNSVKNILMAYEKYYFTENEKGIQVNDFNGQTSPFTYPYLTPVKNRITYDDIHPNYDVLLDKLFVFSTQKEGTYKGIINIDGKIILPEKFTNISIRHIYYYTNPSDEFRVYFKENNLENFYYFTVRNDNPEDEYTLFNKEGLEIIKFKHGNNLRCSPEFDLMEKNQLRIKFHCSDSLKIYDLNTKKQIYSESKRKI